MFVSTNGYIIFAIDPYLANPKNNDAAITIHIFLTNSQCINDWFLPNDLLNVDRGFRDCLEFLEKYEMKTKMFAFVNKAEKHFQFVKPMRIISLGNSDRSMKAQIGVLKHGSCSILYYLIQ